VGNSAFIGGAADGDADPTVVGGGGRFAAMVHYYYMFPSACTRSWSRS
jgi:hypothetical protein